MITLSFLCCFPWLFVFPNGNWFVLIGDWAELSLPFLCIDLWKRKVSASWLFSRFLHIFLIFLPSSNIDFSVGSWRNLLSIRHKTASDVFSKDIDQSWDLRSTSASVGIQSRRVCGISRKDSLWGEIIHFSNSDISFKSRANLLLFCHKRGNCLGSYWTNGYIFMVFGYVFMKVQSWLKKCPIGNRTICGAFFLIFGTQYLMIAYVEIQKASWK